ncbi:triose-phosphate isomerase [Candidatus Sumerlaeota bacterium]|nr:triose-phosphate isomerase [Candidatus Sumerlaeota bacterium]
MSRIPLIAGNWKMYKLSGEATDLVKALIPAANSVDYCEVAVCPPFTALSVISNLVKGTKISLGAQNCYPEKEGAFTGEISPAMLKDIGCKYTIVGHSERRKYFAETDAFINQKLFKLYEYNLLPILCVGETLEEREAGKMKEVVGSQIKKGLANVPEEKMQTTVIAYEPVWAIGTGKNATPEQAQEMHLFIRALLGEIYNATLAESIRIQYGGSVKPSNVKELMSQKDIDGALVGGASLKSDQFIPIIKFRD